MSDSRLLDIARQGDPRAIATLLNAVLLPKRVKATVVRQAEELMITLHSEKMLNQGAAVTLIRTALEKLHLPEIQRVFIESRVLGVPLWESHFALQVIPPVQPPPPAIADPSVTETAPSSEPSPPEPTLLDLMSAFMTAEAPATSESQDTVARSPQDEIPEIDPDEDISLADLAAAFDPNPPSPEPNTDREELTSEPPSIPEERIESNTLDGVSEAVPILEVAAEPAPEVSEATQESIATTEAQESVAEIPEPTPEEFSEATLEQPTLEAYDFPEPTTEDIAALEALETEISPQTAITSEMTAEAVSSPEGAPDAVPVDPWAVSDTLPTAPPVPSESSAIPQDQEPTNYPPLRDPWLEAEPTPQVKADQTQEPSPPPETATETPPPPSESEIYTTPTIEKVPRDDQSKVAGIAGMVMGLGFCATGLGTIIGLPMVVGSMWMLGDEEVWSGECPHCHQPLKIPVGKLWRFSCEKCQGLIEVKQGRFYARQAPPTP